MRKAGIVGGGLTAMIFLAVAAYAAPGDNLASAILTCSAQADGKAQLACYNRIAAALKVGTSAPATTQQPTVPAPRAPADFGRGSISFADHAPEPPDQITAHVASVSYNFSHRFTVALDNGQVWRQRKATNIARLNKADAVTIARGFLGSFHLTIRGRWGTFSVRRIK